MRNKPAALALIAAVLLMAPVRAAFAHKMLAACRVHDDGTALAQAFFPDGKPARMVHVQVYRPDGSLFVEGRADDKGKFDIRTDGAPGLWRVTFTGSMGHKVESRFTIAAPEGAAPASAARPA
ncbi:MAG: hypothetical protein J7M08_02605, partial [Planctomycetes bacterium]|nr:hypothetical protein [Planctomycetota bacterium]